MKTKVWLSGQETSDSGSPKPGAAGHRRGKCAARGLLCVVLSATLGLPAFASGDSRALARAEVIGSEPIFRTVEVAVPRAFCRDERVRQTHWQSADYDDRYDDRYDNERQSRRSRTPGIVGAIIGGAIGHSVGHGKKNKKIGTAVGAILGGTIGGDISRRNHERHNQDQRNYDSRYENLPVSYRTERVCREQTDYRTEQQISGYDVTYVYAGETYSTVLDEDPGQYLDVRVRVSPVPL